MKYASIRACPVLGGALREVDERAARQIPGVIEVVRLDNAVAVIGEHTWAAFAGVRALEIDWALGDNAGIDSAQMEREIRAALDKPGAIANEQGDIDAALKDAANTFEAEYEMPFLAHAALEPMTCVAEVRADAVELWVGTQVPVRAQTAAAEAAGRLVEQVIVNNQLIGGAFGRRLEVDFISQAVAIGGPGRLSDQADLDARGRHHPRHVPPALHRPFRCRAGCRRSPAGLAPHHRRRLGAGPFRARGGAGERP